MRLLNQVFLAKDDVSTHGAFALKDCDFGKYSLIYTIPFLSIQLLNKLMYPFHLIYGLLPFLLIIFSVLNSF